MNALNSIDLAAALLTLDLPAIARHVAAHAYQSAIENGSTNADVDAADTCGEWRRLSDICGCADVAVLADADAKRVSRLAVSVCEGRA